MNDAATTRGLLRITCADALQLMTVYLDEALETSDLARFRAHIDGCEACAVYLDQLGQTVRVVASVSGSEDYQVDESVMAQLMARFRDPEAP